jgi:hypothetical protein
MASGVKGATMDCGSNKKSLGDAPCWGSFDFYYRGVLIRVPAFLNNVARSSGNYFWNSLISKYSNSKYIPLTYEDVKELYR